MSAIHPIRAPVAPNTPRPIPVKADRKGRPVAVDGVLVQAISEDWLIDDRWWDKRIYRRGWRIVTVRGRNVEVFRDLVGGGWFTHRT